MQPTAFPKPMTGSSLTGKEFTEKWIQSLTLSASMPSAQKVKPFMNDIDSICASKYSPESLDAAKRLWAYCKDKGLQSLLETAPFQANGWMFDDDENFRFERTECEDLGTEDDWLNGIGVQAGKVNLVALVTHDDWTNLIRKDAVRLGKPLNVGAIPQGKLLKLPCVAHWDTSSWTIRFENPDWMQLKYESIFTVERPEYAEVENSFMEAVRYANSELIPKSASLINQTFSIQPWMSSIEKLKGFHQRVLTQDEFKTHSWFRRVWACVWPVIYRERNRLKGACDITLIRVELEACFRNVPELTIWMFVFARLVCQQQVSNGVGISGDYRA